MLVHLVLTAVLVAAPATSTSLPSSSSVSAEPVALMAIGALAQELRDVTRCRRGREPDLPRAIEVVEHLQSRYDVCGRRDQKTIVKTLDGMLARADEAQVREVAMVSATVLGALG